jgi:hypothetical protein
MEFNIPANEAEISVSAMVNKNAGIPLPKKPLTMIGSRCLFFILFIKGIAKGKRNKNEIIILKPATSIALNPFPFQSIENFIRIKDPPQVAANNKKMLRLRNFFTLGANIA